MQDKTLIISLPNDVNLEMIYIEGGEFLMGDDYSKYDLKKPTYKVRPNSFYLGKYQVTQSQWQGIMNNTPSRFKGENRPVENVLWEVVEVFVKELSKKTNQEFRLPTEEEWEYAARGGSYSEGYIFSGSDKLKQVGWYDENSNNETHDVGLLLANELGLYDMSGNVHEWCTSVKYDNHDLDPKNDLNSQNEFKKYFLRGGSYRSRTFHCHPAPPKFIEVGYRGGDFGFRLALSL